MKICFPITVNQGLASSVFDHFGSAQRFILVDTETESVVSIDNEDLHHVHGACNPLKALAGNQVDAIVVGGIGGGALAMLNRAGVKVYTSQAATVGENIALFKSGAIQELVARTCGGHGEGHGAGHSCGCSH
jgi:predicted Fe-Mo cluster-binding NifX family protein